MSSFRRQSRADSPKKRTGWAAVNGIVAALVFFLPFWVISFIYTPGITVWLMLIAALLCLTLGIVSKTVSRLGKGRPVLYLHRAAAICSLPAVFLPMVLLTGFDQVKPLYPVKRFVYIQGVYGMNSESYEKLLPMWLPEVCEDYSYRAQGSMIAQDYHPTSWLRFTTDSATLDSYAQYYDAQGYARGADERDRRWLAGQLGLPIPEDDTPALEGAVVYYIHDNYPKAVVLDYENGRFYVFT